MAATVKESPAPARLGVAILLIAVILLVAWFVLIYVPATKGVGRGSYRTGARGSEDRLRGGHHRSGPWDAGYGGYERYLPCC